MTTHDIQILNTAQRVCKRPKMYTNGGTLAEVLALFAGYELGVLAHAAKPSDDSPALTIKWLDEQLGIDTRRPDHRHEAALKKYKSESSVLAAMDNFAETLHSK